LAELHLAGADYAPRRENALGSHGWRPLLERCNARADEVHQGLAGELDTTLTQILAAWPSALPEGHIHADLFPTTCSFWTIICRD